MTSSAMARSIFWRSRLRASSALGDGQGFGQVAGQEEAQGVFGGFEAAGGVETGRELEADFVGAEQGRGLSDSFQGDQAGALGGVEAFQASGDQDAVLAGERDDVGDGAEGDQVEQGAQVEVGCAGQAGFASALEEGVGEFEGEAGGAEFGEGGRSYMSWTGLHGLHEEVGAGAGRPSWGLTRAVAAGAGEETWWWSRTITSTPRWRSEAMEATAVEPQSTASSRVAGNFARQFSTPSWLRP